MDVKLCRLATLMVLVALSYEVSDGEFTAPVNTSITVTPVDDILTGNAIDGYIEGCDGFCGCGW